MSSSRLRVTVPVVTLLVALVAAPVLAGPADDARAAAAERRWSDAADAWGKVLAGKPADREAAVGLARAAIEGVILDAYLPAEEALLKVLEAKEGDREARLTLGDLYIAIAQSKTDQQAMKFTYEDAKSHFERLVEADPADEEAVVGLARTYWWTAFFVEAEQVLDEFLAKAESKGPAHYWKGQVYYTQATDAFRTAGNQLDDRGRELFEKAKASYEEATALAPDHFDTWMQLGYCAQYVGDLEASEQAYVKALDLDAESLMPLKGIEAIYFHRQDEYLDALRALARDHPKNVAVYYFLGFRQLWQKEFDDAVGSFSTYVARSGTPERAWTLLGRAYEGQGNAAKARDAFEKALRASPDDAAAAAALDRRLVEAHADDAKGSVKAAQAAVRAYEPLLKLAPRNPWVRNNLAFLLRDALDRNQGDAAWKPVLDDCIRFYEEASRLAEDQLRGQEATLPYAKRHEYAGVINDTGLMYHYYDARRDLRKAEDYYIRALQLTDDGYGDAFANLVKVYLAQERWQEAYDLARDCAESLTQADGTPHPNRAVAREVMDRLVRDGRVTAD